MAPRVGHRIVQAQMHTPGCLVQRGGPLHYQRQRKALTAECCGVGAGGDGLPGYPPQVAVVGDVSRSGSGFNCACGHRGQALVPSAGVARVKGHGLGARSVRGKRGLQQLAALYAD